jgi:TetR/AcrR family transcriptional repressor of nem operon
MARPAEFDRNDALAGAIRVFARHGYEAASTNDLLAGMGIGRQSLYGAFKDKRRLFLEALARYSQDSYRQMQDAMDGKPAVGALIDALLAGLGSSDDLETGCLGVGSIVEFSRSDPDVAAQNDEAGRRVVELFAAKIRDGMADGEIAADIDADAAARLLLTLRSGLKVAARSGASAPELLQTARLALRSLAVG